MRNQHSNKTIAFLMELIFVLLFFTIASAISVFVIVSAHDKNEHAADIRNALLYGENLINTDDDKTLFEKEHFYLDEEGNVIQKQGYYEVVIEKEDIQGLSSVKECKMKILHNGEKLVDLSFVSGEDAL